MRVDPVPVAAIVQPADLSIQRFVHLDAKVDEAEGDGIMARWEFGRQLLLERVGKQLPAGRLNAIAKSIGKDKRELQYRVQLAEVYASEEEVRTAVHTLRSWTAIRETFAKPHSEPVATSVHAPEGTFATIVADPPWQYDNKATRGAAEDHYPTMSIDELCALPVNDWAAEQGHLYLWTTNGFLREAFGVMDAWGFSYKTTLVWVKPQIGMGNYFRSSAEYVLFGIRGGLRTRDCNQPNWFEAPRAQHSKKPGYFFDLVEKVSFPPYLEMFARQRRLNPDWDYWGNEA